MEQFKAFSSNIVISIILFRLQWRGCISEFGLFKHCKYFRVNWPLIIDSDQKYMLLVNKKALWQATPPNLMENTLIANLCLLFSNLQKGRLHYIRPVGRVVGLLESPLIFLLQIAWLSPTPTKYRQVPPCTLQGGRSLHRHEEPSPKSLESDEKFRP